MVDGRYTGRVVGQPNMREGKVERLARVARGPRQQARRFSRKLVLQRFAERPAAAHRASPIRWRSMPMRCWRRMRGTRAGRRSRSHDVEASDAGAPSRRQGASRCGSRTKSRAALPLASRREARRPGLRSCWSATMRRRRSTSATSGGRRTTVGMRSFAHDLPADDERSRAARADRRAQRRSRGQRHPRAAAAAEAHRRRARDRAHRSAEGRRRLPSVQRRPAGARSARRCGRARPTAACACSQETGEDLVGKHAVVIGQSNIVGRPMALELLMARCTVTICHSATRDLPGIVRQARHRRRRRRQGRSSCRATGSSRARS